MAVVPQNIGCQQLQGLIICPLSPYNNISSRDTKVSGRADRNVSCCWLQLQRFLRSSREHNEKTDIAENRSIVLSDSDHPKLYRCVQVFIQYINEWIMIFLKLLSETQTSSTTCLIVIVLSVDQKHRIMKLSEIISSYCNSFQHYPVF